MEIASTTVVVLLLSLARIVINQDQVGDSAPSPTCSPSRSIYRVKKVKLQVPEVIATLAAIHRSRGQDCMDLVEAADHPPRCGPGNKTPTPFAVRRLCSRTGMFRPRPRQRVGEEVLAARTG